MRSVGLGLLLSWLMVWGWLGGVSPWPQAVAHGFVAGSLFLLARRIHLLPFPGDAVKVLTAATWPALVLSAGMIPVTLEVSTLSRHPEATVGTLAFWTLAAGSFTLAAGWGSSHRSRGQVLSVLIPIVLVTSLSALAHRLVGASAAFGIFPTSASGPYLPLVNVNHTAALSNLALPLSLHGAYEAPRALRPWSALTAAVLLSVVAVSGSVGGLTVSLLLLVVSLSLRHRLWALPFLLAGLAFLLSRPHQAFRRIATDPDSRIQLWETSLQLWGTQPLWGVGAGAYDTALNTVRTDTRFSSFAHAHSDWIEWWVEHGILGVLCLVPLVVVLSRLRPVSRSLALWRAAGWGVAGLLVHAAVDFPLQIPAISLAVVIGAGVVIGAASQRGPRYPPKLWRRLLLSLAAAQILGAAWRIREGVADHAAEVLKGGWHAQAAQRLAWTAPWRSDAVRAALRALSPPAPERLDPLARLVQDRWPDEFIANLTLGEAQRRLGHHEDAHITLQRAVQQHTWDWRGHVALARTQFALGRHGEALDSWTAAFHRGAPASWLDEALTQLPYGTLWLPRLRQTTPAHLRQLAQWSHGRDDRYGAALAWDAVNEMSAATRARPYAAKAWLRAGDVQTAERRARDALTLAPDDIGTLRVLSRILEQTGRETEAWELMRSRWPQVPQILPDLLELFGQQEGPDAALRWLEVQRRAGRVRDEAIWSIEARLEASRGHTSACARLYHRHDPTTTTIGTPDPCRLE